jgi:hypothetical protein
VKSVKVKMQYKRHLTGAAKASKTAAAVTPIACFYLLGSYIFLSKTFSYEILAALDLPI